MQRPSSKHASDLREELEGYATVIANGDAIVIPSDEFEHMLTTIRQRSVRIRQQRRRAHQKPSLRRESLAFHFKHENGERMTTSSYDDEVALRCYVLRHRRDLMTPLERRVIEYTAPIVSEASRDRLDKLYNNEMDNSFHLKIVELYEFLERRDGHVDDDSVFAAFQHPHETRSDTAVSRVVNDLRHQIMENRCPICHRILQTPAAQQCLWCGQAWH